MLKHADTFDFILDTVPAKHDINGYINALKRDGTLALVGAVPEPLSFDSFGLLFGRKQISGLIIGGIRETREMLDFCGEHNVTAAVEWIGVEHINQAYDRSLKTM